MSVVMLSPNGEVMDCDITISNVTMLYLEPSEPFLN